MCDRLHSSQVLGLKTRKALCLAVTMFSLASNLRGYVPVFGIPSVSERRKRKLVQMCMCCCKLQVMDQLCMRMLLSVNFWHLMAFH